MIWGRRATSQWWPRFMLSYDVTCQQWDIYEYDITLTTGDLCDYRPIILIKFTAVETGTSNCILISNTPQIPNTRPVISDDMDNSGVLIWIISKDVCYFHKFPIKLQSLKTTEVLVTNICLMVGFVVCKWSIQKGYRSWPYVNRFQISCPQILPFKFSINVLLVYRLQ